jgi:hypothetical protein
MLRLYATADAEGRSIRAAFGGEGEGEEEEGPSVY